MIGCRDGNLLFLIYTANLLHFIEEQLVEVEF